LFIKFICSRIITEQPYLPYYLSFDAAHFISKLLDKDPRQRLGGGKEDAEEPKRHSFSNGMDWSDVAQENFWPPFEPRIINEVDVSKFLDKFTQMIPADLSVTLPPKCDKIFICIAISLLW
jgi:serine/threonine protein kinase